MTKPSSTRFFVLVACACAMLSALFLIKTEHLPHERTTNQLWSEAILHSLPAKGVDPTHAPSLYLTAIRNSSSPANIAQLHVAFGDFLDGPLPVSVSWNEMFEDEQRVFQAGRDRTVADAMVQEVWDLVHNDNAAVTQYRKALECDPNQRVAHFRLATLATGDDALRSMRWMTEHDPQNALGPLLEASRLVEGDTIEFLTLVQKATQRTDLFFYPDPLPEPCRITFPRMYDELEGRPVPFPVLKLIAKRQTEIMRNISDPLRHHIESVLARLVELSKPDSMSRKDAVRLHQRLCHQVMFNSSLSLSPFFAAYSSHLETWKTMESLWPDDSDEMKFARIQHEQMNRYRRFISTEWSNWWIEHHNKVKSDDLFRAGQLEEEEQELKFRLRKMALTR